MNETGSVSHFFSELEQQMCRVNYCSSRSHLCDHVVTNVSVNNIECDSFLKALSDSTAQLIKYYKSEFSYMLYALKPKTGTRSIVL